VQALPDKEQSCDVANARSATSVFTRAKKVRGSRLIQPTPMPSLSQRQILQQVRHVQHHQNPSQRGFLLLAKTLGELSDIFFYVGIPDNIGISYAFPSTKLARTSLGAEVR
jgi:hypothetical protein